MPANQPYAHNLISMQCSIAANANEFMNFCKGAELLQSISYDPQHLLHTEFSEPELRIFQPSGRLLERSDWYMKEIYIAVRPLCSKPPYS